MKQQSLEYVERIILEQVRFLNLVLEETRKRNKFLSEKLEMSYAKLIGLGTPYELMIHSLRQVKREMDMYLKIIRDKMMEAENQSSPTRKKRKRQKSF